MRHVSSLPQGAYAFLSRFRTIRYELAKPLLTAVADIHVLAS
jgi:hypothetical protein